MTNVITIVFYLIMATLVLYSILAFYALLKFGRSKIISLTVSILYLIIIVSLYAAAVGNLNKL
jgi:hypothetical protein